MSRVTTTLMVGILIGSFVTQATLRAQQSEPAAKGPKLTLNTVEAQVTALQTQVNSLESELRSLETKVTSQPMFAVVNEDGGLARGSSNVVKTGHIDTGLYRVTFNKDVSGCAYNATAGGPGMVPTAGLVVAVAQDEHDRAAVVVVTTDLHLVEVDKSFHLSVNCE